MDVSEETIASISESVATVVEGKLKEMEERLGGRLIDERKLKAMEKRLGTRFTQTAARLTVLQAQEDEVMHELQHLQEQEQSMLEAVLTEDKKGSGGRARTDAQDSDKDDPCEASDTSSDGEKDACSDGSLCDALRRSGFYEEEEKDKEKAKAKEKAKEKGKGVSFSGTAPNGATTEASPDPPLVSLPVAKIPSSSSDGSIKEEQSSMVMTLRATVNQQLDEGLRKRDLLVQSQGPVQRRFSMIVHHQWFDPTFGVIIFLNALFLGSEVEYTTTHGEPQGEAYVAFLIVNYSFLIVFVLELTCRLMASNRHLFLMPDWRWIIFDSCMVLVSLTDIIVLYLPKGSGSFTSTMKIVRILRLMRIARVLRFIPPLRIIIFSIIACMRSLFWLVILLVIILYVFSLCFTMAATEHARERDHASHQLVLGAADAIAEAYVAETELVELYFGTVARSLYSCLKALLGGQSWGELMDPLISVGWFYGCVFTLYILFSILALLNIVTGVFVNGALEKSANEREMVAEKEINRRKACIDQLQQIFLEADDDHTGQITLEEFRIHMRDPTVEAYISTLHIDTTNIDELFHLLDKDDSGSITVHEFVANLLELMHHHHQPGVNEQQIEKMRQQQIKLRHHFAKFSGATTSELRAIRAQLTLLRHSQCVSVAAQGDGRAKINERKRGKRSLAL